MTNSIPDKVSNKGIKRIYRAMFFSFAGLKTAFQKEAAFRQEITLSLILLPTLFWFPVPVLLKLLVIFAHSLVLITELLNSAIESIVDLASPDYHDLAKHAKDIGSAAVFVSLIPTTILWGCVLYFTFFDKL